MIILIRLSIMIVMMAWTPIKIKMIKMTGIMTTMKNYDDRKNIDEAMKTTTVTEIL